MIVNQKKRHLALKELNELMDNPFNVLVIHYSCESFYNRKDGSSPKITSIAIRNFNNGQTRSFSIHKEAELKNLPINEIEDNYKELEKSMLEDFYRYINMNTDKNFLHWNMRDENYGFGAIELRFRVLGGTPYEILNNQKKDLAQMLKDIYGRDYIGDIDSDSKFVGHLYNLVEINKINNQSFLKGNEEAEAFNNKLYVSLHQSTLRKVYILATIAERAFNDELKTNSKYWEIHGGKIRSFFNFFNKNPFIGGIIALFSLFGIPTAICTFITLIVYLFKLLT